MHWIVALLWLAALLALQWKLGQGFIAQANQNPLRFDQDAYMALAKANLPFVWPAYTDGIRTPLFPFLIKFWASDDNAQFFAVAKQANVCFGLAATALLALYFLWKLPLLPALNVGTISALIILPASVFVTAEAIYYALFSFSGSSAGGCWSGIRCAATPSPGCCARPLISPNLPRSCSAPAWRP